MTTSNTTGGPFTVADAAEALRAGDVSSVELTRTSLDRVARLNESLGAFITVTEDAALSAAQRADAELQDGTDRGPLHGIPFALKDILATKDAPTTANSNVLDPSWGEGYDSVVAERVRAGGAVLIGKLVLSEFAIGTPDPETGFPIPRNPWDRDRTPAGSSSGTGIAVATGMILGGIGTDTGGSVRSPAAANGISGLKVTFGRVPKWGCVPLGYTLDTIGPMARSARDCALILGVIAGHDARDATSIDAPVNDYVGFLDGNASGLRVGVPAEYFFTHEALDPEVKSAVERSLAELEAAGAEVREVTLPHASLAREANSIIMSSEAFAYHRINMQQRWNDYGRGTRTQVGRGALYAAADYVQAQRFRTYFRKVVGRVLEEVDVLVTPTATAPAEPVDAIDAAQRMLRPSFTSPWNLAGLPALAIPCGLSAAGLPLSMQVVGKPFDEGTVLRVGDAFQRHTDWHLLEPPIVSESASP